MRQTKASAVRDDKQGVTLCNTCHVEITSADKRAGECTQCGAKLLPSIKAMLVASLKARKGDTK